MSVLMKFLLSLAAHAAWQRMGQRGPVPPMRLKGKTTPLPTIAPWQMMIASWVLNQLWGAFGGEVKSRLQSARHPLIGRVGKLLPNPTGPLAGTRNFAPRLRRSSKLKAHAPGSAAVHAQPQYDTQPLPSVAQPQNSSRLPKGSVLSSLRDSTA